MFKISNFEKTLAHIKNPDLDLGVWTQIRFARETLCNSVEFVDWDSDPVQLTICDFCGTPGCSSGGYARVTTTGSQLLLVEPELSFDGEEASYSASHLLRRFGALVIPADVAVAMQIAPLTRFRGTTRRDIINAWLLDSPFQTNLPLDIEILIESNDLVFEDDSVREVLVQLMRPDSMRLSELVIGSFQTVEPDTEPLSVFLLQDEKTPEWKSFVRRKNQFALRFGDYYFDCEAPFA